MQSYSMVLLVVSLICLPLAAQETSQASQGYNEQYLLYEKANAEKDAVQKRAICLEFVKKFKSSELDAHISAMYAQNYAGLRQAAAWQQLATMAEEYLRYRPSDVASIAAATEAYQKLNSPEKLVTFGTRLYAQSPNVGTAYFVAKAYHSMNDRANYLKWTEKTLQHDPDNLEMLVEAVTGYWQQQNLPKAASYAKKALKALEATPCPQGVSAAAWKVKGEQINAFASRALGEEAFFRNAFPESLKFYKTSAKFDPKNDTTQYRLGQLHWQVGNADLALRSFAKAVVIHGPVQSDAQKQLNQLYRQRYGNAAGVPKLLQSAKAELGIK